MFAAKLNAMRKLSSNNELMIIAAENDSAAADRA